MPLEAVFFDLGNTLLSERPSRAAIYAQVAGRHGLSVSVAEMDACMVRAHAALPREIDGAFRYTDAWFRRFQRHIFVEELGLGPASFARLSDELFAPFEDACTFVLYPGARELLSELRVLGLRLGLISNWSERLPRLLSALELSGCFDLVLGSAAERMEKPEPALFRAALERAEVPADLALHAGDQIEKDAQGALAVGMGAVLVDHHGRLGTRRAPCPIARNLAELRGLILERVR